MESSPFPTVLSDIRKVVSLVDKRRREHAVALWAVDDFLAGLERGLVPYEDSEELVRGARLAVVEMASPPVTPTFREVIGEPGERPSRWMLAVVGEGSPGEPIPAYDAAPDIVSRAVRELPAFLDRYLRALQEAAGSKVSVEAASAFVAAASRLLEQETASRAVVSPAEP